MQSTNTMLSSCSSPLVDGRRAPIGAVINDYGDVKLLEISDDHGQMLDSIQAAESQLKPISKRG
jgi:hypothetical protein